MSRAAWAAIIAAITFPTVALVVVLLAGPRHPPGPPHPPGIGATQGKAPPGHPPPPLGDEMLVRMRSELELSEEQVDRIWKIGEPARRRIAELQVRIGQKEGELHEVLTASKVDEADVERRMEELHDLRLDLDKLAVLTPLRLREVLSEEQQSKLLEGWRRGQGKAPGPGAGARHGKGPGPFGPGPGKGGARPGGHPPRHGKHPPRGPLGPPHGPLAPPPGPWGPPPGPSGPPPEAADPPPG